MALHEGSRPLYLAELTDKSPTHRDSVRSQDCPSLDGLRKPHRQGPAARYRVWQGSRLSTPGIPSEAEEAHLRPTPTLRTRAFSRVR
jgi:hypothetical protein